MKTKIEIAALWAKEGKRGTFYSGPLRDEGIAELKQAGISSLKGLQLLAFLETDKRNARAPDLRVYAVVPDRGTDDLEGF